MLMLIIYISSVSIPLENSSHVYPILFSARRGIVQILRKKAITVWTEAGAIFLCFAIPETYRLLETTPVNTAVQSLQTMRECAYDLTIGGYWLLLWGCRLLFLLGISSVVLLVGFLPKTTLGGIAVGEGFFGMINLLPVLFPSWNIPFLPVTLISSCHIAWSGIAAAGVSGICLCILLLFFLQKPFIYRLIRL